MKLSDQFCSVPGCLLKVYRKGMCNRHNLQIRRKGEITIENSFDLPGEKWADCYATNYTTYKISNLGRVKSINGRVKILKPQYNKNNQRMQCHLGRKKLLRLNTAVAHSFVPNPFNDSNVIFLDGDKKNCKADNLQWYGVFWFEKSLNALKAENNEDARDIVAFMEGDNDAINRILQERTGKIIGLIKMKLTFYRNIYKNTHNIDVEAIAQDVLIVAVRAIRRGLLRHTGSISSWFGKIAQNTLKNACLKQTLSEVDMYGTYSDSGEEYDNSDRAVYSEWREKERNEAVGL